MTSKPAVPPPLIVVDGANVVGSVPDGWWRDRLGAHERLRDSLVRLDAEGLPERASVPRWACRPPVDIVLVVEGAARGLAPVPGVRIAAAAGSGDDRIVELVAHAMATTADQRCLVVTADRALRERVSALGAVTAGPLAVR